MIRRLVVLLLTGVICLIGANSLLADQSVIYSTIEEYEEAVGTKIEKFSEAPMLREKVAAGELAPLEERLPEEPLVVQPADKIGKYGGVLQTAHVGSIDFVEDLLREFPVVYSNDLQDIKPNIFKSWEVSEDGRTFIFHIRKGIKWSDGYPFTADDFMFWYEDIACNKELKPAGVSNMKIGGEMGKAEKIDDYTIKFSFVKPYGIFVERLCRWRPVPYVPKHYLKQFHPNYTSKDELDKMVKEGGFDSWVSLFEHERYFPDNPKVPTICAWKVVTRFSEPVHQLVRNPYYWKIDTAGNQLPYTDGIHATFAGDAEGLLIKALAGELDYSSCWLLGFATNYPLLKENQKRSNYRLVRMNAWSDTFGTIFFNYSHKDPVLRQIFGDKRFRIALSVAMVRDKINKVVFKGMYTPSQPAPPDGPPYYGELPMFHLYTQYDPQLANHLLDLVGLKWDEEHKIRLRPDGKPLKLVANVMAGWDPPVTMAEMYKKYWKDIGIQITLKPLSPQFYGECIRAGQHEIGIATINVGGRGFIIAAMRGTVVPISPSFATNPPWAQWLLSEGEKGEEPPEGIKRLFEINKEFMSEPDAEKRASLEKELYIIWSENLWIVGGIKQPAEVPQIFYTLFSNRVKNTPSPCSPEWYYAIPSSWSIEE